MNKKAIIICIVISLIMLFIGIFIGFYIKEKSKLYISGTYITTTWNGKEGILIINSDRTLCMPSGEIYNWKKDGNNLVLSNGETITIMENGLTFSGHVFAKK